MKIDLYIRGGGRAGQAIQFALGTLKTTHKNLNIGQVEVLKRGAPLASVVREPKNSVLVLSNPPGLHREGIKEAESLGMGLIVCEKPVCVNLAEVDELKSIKTKTAVLHGYRQTWGVQTLKKMIASQEVGELIAIEGRYWQSSAAKRALSGDAVFSWKNDISLSGASDTLIDIGCHWSDAAIFLAGMQPSYARLWLSHANAEAPHRDTHVQMNLEFPDGLRAMSSVSKTVHGAGNHFEVNVLGTKQALTWTFLNPDQILVGRGGQTETRVRGDNDFGSGLPAFHGMGWVEGYVEIFRQSLAHMQGQPFTPYPNLAEALFNMEMLLKAKAAAKG